MTNKPPSPSPPSLAMRPNLPGRKPGQAQKPMTPTEKSQVEVEKLDPAVLGVRKSPEQELLENAEPIVPSPVPTRPMPQPMAPAPMASPSAPPPPEKKDFLDENVPDKLIDKLVEEYGFEEAVIREKIISAATGKSLKVHVRSMTWDDYSWALSTVQRKEKEDREKHGLIMTDAQRAQFYQALVACRCVVKIADAWVWDLFELRSSIKNVQPNWSGETHVGMQEFFMSALALKTFDLFRKKLHPDFLFQLDDAVRSLTEAEEKEPEPEAGEDPNPMQAT